MLPPILMVEDDLPLAQTMALSIENGGIPVEHCATAETAIELIRQKRYAVIVVDVILEAGASGIYVIDELRKLPPEQRPLVVVTTGATLEMLRGVDRTVVAAVLLKPLDFELFTSYIVATYRRAVRDVGELALSEPLLTTTVLSFCGNCGSDIPAWIFDPPYPADPGDTFQLWLDTPCTRCGTTPRQAGGRSQWRAEGETLKAEG